MTEGGAQAPPFLLLTERGVRPIQAHPQNPGPDG